MSGTIVSLIGVLLLGLVNIPVEYCTGQMDGQTDGQTDGQKHCNCFNPRVKINLCVQLSNL